MKQDFPGTSLTLIPWAWIVLIVLVVSLFFGLAGCTTLEEFARQNQTPTPNYPPFVRIVQDANSECVAMGAPSRAGEVILACSDPFGRFLAGLCLVLLPTNYPPSLKEHELLHCKYGYWHN